MKKTFVAVALSSLFASVAANAAVVYDKDGQSIDLYGRAQANIFDKDGARNNYTSVDSDAMSTTLVGSGRLGVRTSSAITNQASVFTRGEWKVNAENSNKNDQFVARYVYIGLDGGQFGKVIAGQSDTAYYDTLVVTDIFDEWGDSAYSSLRQEGQIIYSGAWDGFRTTLGYQLSDASQGLDSAYGASVGYTFATGFGFGLGGENREYDNSSLNNTNNFDQDSRWAVNAAYGTFGLSGFYTAVLYSEADTSYLSHPDTKDKAWELVAAYSFYNNWTILTGYNRYYQEGSLQNVTDYYLFEAQYKLTPSLISFVEYRLDNGTTLGAANNDAMTLAVQYNF